MYFEMFKESDIKHKIHISDFKIEILYKVVSQAMKVSMNINLMEQRWDRKHYNWSMTNDYYEEVVCEHSNILQSSKVFINIVFPCAFLN